MRKIRRVIYLTLIVVISQVPNHTLYGTQGLETFVLEASFIPKESSKEGSIENPMMSLGLFFNLLKAA